MTQQIKRPLTKEEQRVVEVLRHGPDFVPRDELVRAIREYGLPPTEESWMDRHFLTGFAVVAACLMVGGLAFAIMANKEEDEKSLLKEEAWERARDRACEKDLFVKCLGALADTKLGKDDAVYACRNSATDVCMRGAAP